MTVDLLLGRVTPKLGKCGSRRLESFMGYWMTNPLYYGPARLVGALLPALLPGSMITFIRSVAGDRGLRTNFVYGAAKAALNLSIPLIL